MNFDEIVVKESPGICRCCLSEGCYKDLGTEYTWMNETEVYADMLLDCFDISITQHNDGPNGAKRLICEVCITRLRDACNFKKQVVDSERRFIDMLGRGEFKTKVLTYQSSRELKEEAADETPEDVMAEDVEYLEDVDIDYDGEEEEIKTELLQSTSAASSSERPRLKRGRPRKVDDKPDKAKKQKVAKGFKSTFSDHSQDSLTKCSESEDEPQKIDKRLLAMRENVTKVVLNSTVMPFRWLATAYRCFYCYDIFETVPELKAHNLLHDRQEIFKVMQKYWENDVFVDISNLFCAECTESSQSLNDLINHLITEHGIDYDGNTKYCFKPFILEDSEVICGICDSSFKLFNQLLLHATKEHRNPTDFICDVCGRSFKKHQFKMHVQNEHRSKTINCTQCAGVFSIYAIRTHMIKAHGRKVKCKLCSETFPTYYKKQRHMTTVHRTRSEFRCPHCDKVFYFQCTMNRHIKEMHLREKNAMCNVCGWTTYIRSQLKGHMMKHKNTEEIKCKCCNKKFKDVKYLKQHYELEHADELGNENEIESNEKLENSKIANEEDAFREKDKIEVQYLEDGTWY